MSPKTMAGIGIALVVGVVFISGAIYYRGVLFPVDSGMGGFFPSGDGKTPMLEDSGIDAEKPSGTPAVDLPPVAEIPINSDMPVNSTEDAQSVLNQTLPELDLSAGSTLEVGDDTTDQQGRRYYQVRQKYMGIDVYGAASVLEVQNSEAEVLYGVTAQNLEVDVSPSYEADEALQMALASSGVSDDRSIEVLQDTPSLIIIVTEEGALLCWVISAFLTSPITEPEVYAVDAHQPKIVLRNPLVHH